MEDFSRSGNKGIGPQGFGDFESIGSILRRILLTLLAESAMPESEKERLMKKVSEMFWDGPQDLYEGAD